MLLPKKISRSARQISSRKALEKRLKEFKNDDSFKLSKNITTLFIDTKTIVSHFSVDRTWPVDANSQLDKTIEQALNNSGGSFSDPLDAALHVHAAPSSRHAPMHTLLFDQAHVKSGAIWHHGNIYELAIKGAPEHMLAICDLTENEKEQAERKLHQLSGNGGRVVAFAHATLHHKIDRFNDLTKKDIIIFDGFVSFSQHFSPRIKTLITAAHNADVAVYLITGDHTESALYIAKELGITTLRSQVFDSRKAYVMTDEELTSKVKGSHVLARTTPQMRARIMKRFNKSEYVLLDS